MEKSIDKEKLVLVCLSPAIDIVNGNKSAGGKAVNIAKILSNFGFYPPTITVLGDENCDEYRALLDDNVNIIPIITDGQTRMNTLFIGKSERQINNLPTALSEPARKELISKLNDLYKEGATVLFSGSMPHLFTGDCYNSLLKEVSKIGYRLIVDTKSLKLSDFEGLIPHLIKPNREEFIELVSGEMLTDEQLIDKGSELVRKERFEKILLTLGEDGLILITSSGTHRVGATKRDVVSTLGCGDSALAGYIVDCDKGDAVSVKTASRFSIAQLKYDCAAAITKEDVADIF